ncbi:hypothetical protein T265_00832 [Opisthorchis viverrini]|uniref:Uncharacterized protein n=1 Tax=Opisthorchis viverrini TaxID=6198 RepID=A0A075A4X6_OPIVI|nr:hypothetical protein T265_00832 [Opisthorchis viverrini]KER33342.1 hypothetical protein T265_00832 [Opisthorchis viverrini]
MDNSDPVNSGADRLGLPNGRYSSSNDNAMDEAKAQYSKVRSAFNNLRRLVTKRNAPATQTNKKRSLFGKESLNEFTKGIHPEIRLRLSHKNIGVSNSKVVKVIVKEDPADGPISSGGSVTGFSFIQQRRYDDTDQEEAGDQLVTIREYEKISKHIYMVPNHIIVDHSCKQTLQQPVRRAPQLKCKRLVAHPGDIVGNTSTGDESLEIQLPSSASRPTTKQRNRTIYIPQHCRLQKPVSHLITKPTYESLKTSDIEVSIGHWICTADEL